MKPKEYGYYYLNLPKVNVTVNQTGQVLLPYEREIIWQIFFKASDALGESTYIATQSNAALPSMDSTFLVRGEDCYY